MTMTSKRTEMETAATTPVFLFDIQDFDNANAAMQLQMTVMQLLANLQAGTSGSNLVLMDFLR